MTRVGLVACSSLKLDHVAPARELYRSTLFQKSAAYVQASTDRWYVLSARHGLVAPDTILAPYDTALGDPHTGPPMDMWIAMVRDQLRDELAGVPKPTLLILAGKLYRSFLEPSPWPYTVPMKGLRIGEQLSWLTTALKAAQTL